MASTNNKLVFAQSQRPKHIARITTFLIEIRRRITAPFNHRILIIMSFFHTVQVKTAKELLKNEWTGFFLQKSTCTHNSLRSKYTTTPFCTSFTWNMSPFNIDKGENRLRLTDVQTLLMHHHRERERERSGSIDLCYMTRETPVCVGAKRYVRAERIHIGPQSAPSFWAFFLPVIRAYYTCIYMQRVLSEDVILYISSRGESWDRWTKCIVTRGSESESLKCNSVFFCFCFFFFFAFVGDRCSELDFF